MKFERNFGCFFMFLSVFGVLLSAKFYMSPPAPELVFYYNVLLVMTIIYAVIGLFLLNRRTEGGIRRGLGLALVMVGVFFWGVDATDVSVSWLNPNLQESRSTYDGYYNG